MKPLTTKVPPKFPTYVFKLMWRATSKVIKIEAKDYLHAQKAVEREIKKMEGGSSIIDIVFLERRG
jgi:hypothetical protein